MINLGKAIYTILSNNSTITAYVGKKIYPLVIPEDADNIKSPCIVYERNSTANSTKDYISDYTSSLDISIVSNDYAESINIATAVDNALNNYKGVINNINIIDIKLNNVNEVHALNLYLQRLNYSVRTN